MKGGIEQCLQNLSFTVRRILTTSNSKSSDILLKRAARFFDRPCISRMQEDIMNTKMYRKMKEKVLSTGERILKDTYAVGAQKTKRSFQFLHNQRRLYGESSFRNSLKRLLSCLRNRQGQSAFALCSAACFPWHDKKISDDDLDGCIEDMKRIETIQEEHGDLSHYMKNWECVIDKDHFKVWRQPIQGSSLYQYKVYGQFLDITPQAFYRIQIDLDYRKKWDDYAIELNIVDRDPESRTEVVHWVTKYPYPMYSRDYVYVRRFQVDKEKNMMVFMSRATEHPKVPESKQYVRVTRFNSHMVIKPHKSFCEPGLDYVLTYFDDPQSNIPSMAYNWVASTGVPGFLDTLHDAAKKLEEKIPLESYENINYSALQNSQYNS